MIIDYEQQLRELVPNVFATVKGETPLSAKLAPFVSSAEQWIISTFTSMEVMRQICLLDDGTPIKVTVERAVVCEAMRTAIPSLDIVITPNGFGVVSNQNIAPASKERVERLIASLTEQRDELLDALLTELQGFEGWRATKQCQFFAATLFPTLELSDLCGFKSERWEKYLKLRQRAIEAEESLAEEYFSQELMKEFRMAVVGGEISDEFAPVIRGVRAQVVAMIGGEPISTRRMVALVNFIRNRPESFSAWHNSSTAELFTPPVFKNQKKSGGYFF